MCLNDVEEDIFVDFTVKINNFLNDVLKKNDVLYSAEILLKKVGTLLNNNDVFSNLQKTLCALNPVTSFLLAIFPITDAVLKSKTLIEITISFIDLLILIIEKTLIPSLFEVASRHLLLTLSNDNIKEFSLESHWTIFNKLFDELYKGIEFILTNELILKTENDFVKSFVKVGKSLCLYLDILSIAQLFIPPSSKQPYTSLYMSLLTKIHHTYVLQNILGYISEVIKDGTVSYIDSTKEMINVMKAEEEYEKEQIKLRIIREEEARKREEECLQIMLKKQQEQEEEEEKRRLVEIFSMEEEDANMRKRKLLDDLKKERRQKKNERELMIKKIQEKEKADIELAKHRRISKELKKYEKKSNEKNNFDRLLVSSRANNFFRKEAMKYQKGGGGKGRGGGGRGGGGMKGMSIRGGGGQSTTISGENHSDVDVGTPKKGGKGREEREGEGGGGGVVMKTPTTTMSGGGGKNSRGVSPSSLFSPSNPHQITPQNEYDKTHVLQVTPSRAKIPEGYILDYEGKQKWEEKVEFWGWAHPIHPNNDPLDLKKIRRSTSPSSSSSSESSF